MDNAGICAYAFISALISDDSSNNVRGRYYENMRRIDKKGSS